MRVDGFEVIVIVVIKITEREVLWWWCQLYYYCMLAITGLYVLSVIYDFCTDLCSKFSPQTKVFIFTNYHVSINTLFNFSLLTSLLLISFIQEHFHFWLIFVHFDWNIKCSFLVYIFFCLKLYLNNLKIIYILAR